jgi:hypothetical protein
MKKNFTILSLIFLSLFSLTAKAQDDEPEARSYMAFIGGLSFPMGNYGSNNYANSSAGFAGRGQVYGLDFNIILHKNFGLGITAAVQDQGELDSAQVSNLAAGYNSSFSKDQTSVTSVGRYSNLVLMLGPTYTFLFKKFSVDLRAQAGIIKSFTTPALTIVFDYSTNSGQTYYQISSGAVDFAYGGSAGLRYTLSDSWDVGIKLNYVASPGLKINNSTTDPGIGRYQTNMPVNLLQTDLAITLKF